MNNWQPIATVPKDYNNKIDLWIKCFRQDGSGMTDGERYTECTWVEKSRNWFNHRTNFVQIFNKENGDPVRLATHWMYPPQPPEES